VSSYYMYSIRHLSSYADPYIHTCRQRQEELCGRELWHLCCNRGCNRAATEAATGIYQDMRARAAALVCPHSSIVHYVCRCMRTRTYLSAAAGRATGGQAVGFQGSLPGHLLRTCRASCGSSRLPAGRLPTTGTHIIPESGLYLGG
jgi:hypothetical protein